MGTNSEMLGGVGLSAARNRPYLAIGLTFLLLGFGFANRLPLAVGLPRGMWDGQVSREVLDLYALIAYLGWRISSSHGRVSGELRAD